ncbi:MAG: hypothetical protein ACE3L7_26645 [Candidatus Pristimantibacillus sp.]
MKINLLFFLHSIKKGNTPKDKHEILIKTFESPVRPIKGDILDDPGFHPDFHNGYEVAKVTINYEFNECWVSLTPLALEIENIPKETYLNNLIHHGWRTISIEELKFKQ